MSLRNLLKLLSILVVLFILICTISFFTDKSNYGKWSVQNISKHRNEIPWIKFYWANDNLGKKYYRRTAMFISAKIDGLPNIFSFQFDLGSDLTMVYENNLNSIIKKYPELQNEIKKLKSPLQFWDRHQAIKNFSIDFGNTKAVSTNCYIKRNYGETFSMNSLNENDTIKIGTIGADMFQDKILIIDYPNNRFAICDSLPSAYKGSFSNIELDRSGRVILPLIFKATSYKVLFDNGSSLFPLLVGDNKINIFSTAVATDTIPITSWGIVHNVIGRPLSDTINLAGKRFWNILVYADYRKEERSSDYDAITGNALFWNNTIIIDFKNKKFGIR